MKKLLALLICPLLTIFVEAEVKIGPHVLEIVRVNPGEENNQRSYNQLTAEVKNDGAAMTLSVRSTKKPKGWPKEKSAPELVFSVKTEGEKIRFLTSGNPTGALEVMLLEGRFVKDQTSVAQGKVVTFQGEKEVEAGQWILFTARQFKEKNKALHEGPLADPADVPPGFQPLKLTVAQNKKIKAWIAENKSPDLRAFIGFLKPILSQDQAAILKQMGLK